MKHRFFFVLLALAVAFIPAAAAENRNETLIRLHVVADSNLEEAQELKLKVRDAVLIESQEILKGAADSDEAYARIRRNLPAFQQAAEKAIESSEGSIPVQVETGWHEFPERIYDGVCVPAGTYRALNITIGSGQGHNWWCVLYPSLCIVSEMENGGSDGIQFYSSVLRWLREQFGGVHES